MPNKISISHAINASIALLKQRQDIDNQLKLLIISQQNFDTAQLELPNNLHIHQKNYQPHTFNQAEFNERYDMAIVLLDEQDPITAEQNLQRCRDLFAKHTLVFCQNEFVTRPNEFGFSLFCQETCEIEQKIYQIYQFNLFDYKYLPDWFNSKFWANPENWDKFRW